MLLLRADSASWSSSEAVGMSGRSSLSSGCDSRVDEKFIEVMSMLEKLSQCWAKLISAATRGYCDASSLSSVNQTKYTHYTKYKLIHTCYKSSKKKLTSVVKSAEYLSGDLSFTPLADLYGHKLKVKSLRMVATNSEPLLVLSQLPSGRFQAVKHRVQIRAKCFRSECIKYLNSIFHKK